MNESLQNNVNVEYPILFLIHFFLKQFIYKKTKITISYISSKH
jgi:hypothetical protein